MAGKINGLLKSHTCTAKYHFRCFGNRGDSFERTIHQIVFLQTVSTIDGTWSVITDHVNLLAFFHNGKTFSRK